jgi:hypothetical protein
MQQKQSNGGDVTERLENIINKLNKIYPDLAAQIVLSSLSLNKDKMFNQIDCILTIASLREFERIKKEHKK